VTFSPAVQNRPFFTVSSEDQQHQASLVGAVTLTSTTDIGIDCNAYEHDMTFEVTLTATSVGAVHDQVH
jgi:hypothetical protein